MIFKRAIICWALFIIAPFVSTINARTCNQFESLAKQEFNEHMASVETKNIIVSFNDGVDTEKIGAYILQLECRGATGITLLNIINGFAATVPVMNINELQNDSNIRLIENNGEVTALS